MRTRKQRLNFLSAQCLNDDFAFLPNIQLKDMTLYFFKNLKQELVARKIHLLLGQLYPVVLCLAIPDRQTRQGRLQSFVDSLSSPCLDLSTA